MNTSNTSINALPAVMPILPEHATTQLAGERLMARGDGIQDGAADSTKSQALRNAFDEFVGQTFYSQMMKSMRKTVGKPAYFHGGRAEEVFQAEMDQVVVADLAKSSASQFTGPMFDLFQLNLKR